MTGRSVGNPSNDTCSHAPADRRLKVVCESGATENAAASAPRPAEGTAVDPITLPAVDEVRITTLVDNVYDGLLADEPGIRRGPMSAG
ncbi:MAG: hypothetical protein CSB46_11045, partial [Micrococcales bacterium]